MKISNRKDEQGRVPSRTQRFFMNNEYWYYSTREGVDIGPFDTYEEATHGANDFVEFISELQPSFSSTLQMYKGRAVA